MSELQTVVIDTTRSLHVALRPVAIADVTLTDQFWTRYGEVNRRVMIPAQLQLCETTGRIDNLRKAAGQMPGAFEGRFFNDSDVYKWIEAASWALIGFPDAALERQIDDLIGIIGAAQQPDGYLDSYFTGERAAERWTNPDLHEMYCAGHLIQAAAAHFRATDKTSLLTIAIRLADHICAQFGPVDQGKRFWLDGHPEIEMALVELYRLTGDEKYLAQARYFIDERGYQRLASPFGWQSSEYHQDNKPFRAMDRLYGHAVRAIYLNCGAADVYAETGDPTLLHALEMMWQSMVTRQMYAHGGLGSRWENEGFGTDYELPNQHAHAETCASVASVMWNWRMLQIDPQAGYADVMELALYNSVLSGISLDGAAYYYQNPLEDDGAHRREEWFTTACCPANVARLLAELPGYVYSTSPGTLWIHLYAQNSAAIPISDARGEARTVHLRQETDYPWSGDVRIGVDTAGHYALNLRLPDWCRSGWTIAINGQPYTAELTEGRYLHIDRVWQAGDSVTLTLPMVAEWIHSHPAVIENQGRIALRRGPLLYCLEAVDNAALGEFTFTPVPLDAEFMPDLLNGVVVLHGQADRTPSTSRSEALYQPIGETPSKSIRESVPFSAIPYFAWANRAPGLMQVWLREGPAE